MTQGQLACALYPNLEPEVAEGRKGDISKLETGRIHNPTAPTVHALAKALGISDEEIDQLQRRVKMSASEQLDNIAALDRDALELLAGRFDIAGAHSMGDGAIREELTKRAEDWRKLRAEVDAIPDTYRKLTNLKAAAQDAIDRVDPDEVENLLSQVHYTELDEAARSAELRADNALARGDLDLAYRVLNSAANSFEAVDALEPVRRKLRYWQVFYAHGLRYGGAGLALSAQMIRDALTAGLETDAPLLSAKAQTDIATSLASQGIRITGPEGAELLAEAVDSYRAALRVYTEAEHPLDWAMTMQNLGNALEIQGARATEPGGGALLAEAVESYRAALRVYTEADHPVDWAMTMQNLAIALKTQGTRTAGPEGAALLAEAVESYRAALHVRTEADRPVQWAMTMQNLAGALQIQGTRTAGPEGAALLAGAVKSFRAALRVRTEAEHPVGWAMTQLNLATTEKARAEHDATKDPRPHLEAALEHVDAALRVYDPEHMPYDHGRATELREKIVVRLKALD